jgi:ribosomal protein S6--L-glutamate ligase
MMRVAVAGVEGAWSSERMRAALEEAGVDSLVSSLGDCIHDLNDDRVLLDGLDLGELDGIIVKKLASQSDPSARLRLHLLRALERRGVRIFSRPDVIESAMDRYWMNSLLACAGLPLPHTISFETREGLRLSAEELGDAVVKPVYTSKGRGMFRLRKRGRLATGGWENGGGRWLAQRFVDAPGRDIGACVLGGEYVGAFYRVAREGHWMTTTASGGRYETCELPVEGQAIAVKAARLFGLDYTVVDLVEAEAGYCLYEVSAFGGFRGLWTANELDVARLYAAYIKEEISNE